MTSPIPPAAKAACRAALPGLLAAHGVRVTGAVVEDDEGWVNPCYFVGDEVVVRFNSRDPELPKFRREVVAFALARERGVPVPEVVVHDRSLRHSPFEALIALRLPGRPIERSWPDLDEGTRVALAERVGALLASLHGIDPGGFGELAADPGERFPTWHERVVDTLDRHCAAARSAGLLSAEDVRRAQRIVAARSDALATVERASLVHGDLHFGNVLHVGGAVTGVLDFEWSRAGDPVADLLITAVVGEICPGGLAPLLAAYRDVRPEPRGCAERTDVCRLLRGIEMSVVTRWHFPDEAADTLRRTLDLLRTLG